MSVLRHRNFRLVWTGQIISVVGDGMRTIALLWLAKTQSGSNAVVVAVAAATAIPVVMGSPIGGWLADRFDRRRLMVIADVQRGLMSAALAALLFTDRLSTLWLCTLVALAGCGTAVFEPTFAATMPTLVPDDELASANGLNMANSAGGSLVGPLIGGTLLAAVGPEWVLAIDAVSFMVSALFVAAAQVKRPAPRHVGAHELGSVPVTVRSALADGVVRRLGGLACVLNFLAAPLTVLLVVLAIDEHQIGPRMYGVLGMMLPAGLLAGSLLAGRVAAHRLALVGSLVGFGAALTVLGFAVLPVVMVVLVFAGVTMAVANTVLITTLQNAVAPEVQGRAFGILGSASQALRPAGLLMAAPLLGLAGVGGAFAVVGIAMIVTTLAWGRPGGLERAAAAEPGSSVLPELARS